MEHTYERRRREGTGRTGKGKKRTLAPRERRRLVQLAVSAGLFVLVFVGRGVIEPSNWRAVLGRDMDLAAVFESFGRAVFEERSLDSLEELWVEAFAGGAPASGEANEVWAARPDFSQRLARQLTEPEDAVGLWCRGMNRLPAAGAPLAARTAPKERGSHVDFPPEEESEPEAVTAQAQAYTEDGQALPASVSMEYYELGLAEEVTPTAARLTSDYGYRDHPVSGDYKFHYGVDLGAPAGSSILAFSGGTVEFTGLNDVCGLYFQIDHGNGVSTFYAHCSCLYVLDGDTVTAGQVVAEVGDTGNATGPHLHFALVKDGVYLDPLYYIEVE